MYLELLYMSSICFVEFLLTSLLGSSVRMALQGAATQAWQLMQTDPLFFLGWSYRSAGYFQRGDGELKVARGRFWQPRGSQRLQPCLAVPWHSRAAAAVTLQLGQSRRGEPALQGLQCLLLVLQSSSALQLQEIHPGSMVTGLAHSTSISC